MDEWRQRGALVHVHGVAPDEDLGRLVDRLLRARPGLPRNAGGDDAPLLLVLEDPALPSLRARFADTLGMGGRAALSGWLRMDAAALVTYAGRAVALLRRTAAPPAPLVLLGPRESRYQAALDTIEACAAQAGACRTLRWSAERIRKPALLNALRLGAAAALYLGHGDRSGWLAYGGLGSGDFAGRAEPWPPDETTALFFSLGCGGAGPDGMADALVAAGVAGAVLAPLGKPLHADNRRLAQALIEALAQGHRALPCLLEAVRATMVLLHGAGYMVIGDPGLSAMAAPHALARGLGVFAPPPDAVLVPAGTTA
ncbi:hypothetical protein [Roseateles sp.]|uniref:hypothetical protein n=1 Tax=Roseateles sp. TaxID=1971397 RepID=UPI0025D5C480|nr:hypothetical protein [Roseateles sp.]MBV8037112.1 hypothetical protein [Roseateles sp.]